MEKDAILAVRIRGEVKLLRRRAGLSQRRVAQECSVDPSLISRIEAGTLIPPSETLQSILRFLDSEASILANLGLSEEEYRKIRPKNYLHLDIATRLKVDASTANEINQWLLEDVVKRTPGKPPLLADPDELSTYFSQTLNRVRHYASTYPARHGYNSSVSLPFLEALTLGYQGEGPRFVGIEGTPQKWWPTKVFKQLLCPIIATGDERAALAASILKNYEQTYDAFHQQMKRKKWHYLDIVPMSAVQQLVTQGTLSRDSSLKYLGVKELTPEMVKHLLKEAVKLLSYDTYHIALLDDISNPTDSAVQLLGPHLKEHFWTVKPGVDGQLSLILTEWPVDWQGIRREVDRHLNDVEITKAFLEIIGFLWRNMPAKKLVTDKQAVKAYLNKQCRKVPASFRK